MTAKPKRTPGGKPWKRGDGLWCIKIELPRGPDGKRRSKTVCRRDRAAVIAERRRLLRQLSTAGDLPTASPTVSAWLDEWMRDIAGQRLKPSTLKGYRSSIQTYIEPAIGRVRLDQLTAAHVRGMLRRITDQGLSTTTARQAHSILRKALEDAMREGRVGANVASLVDRPPVAVNTRTNHTLHEVRTLLRSERDPMYEAIWATLLLASPRRGELLALGYDDTVDLDARLLRISWQLQRVNPEHGCGPRQPDGSYPCGRKVAGWCPDRRTVISPRHEARHVTGPYWFLRPKSRRGWRVIPITAALERRLRRHLHETYVPNEWGLLFAARDGRPLDPDQLSHAWRRACQAAGIPPLVLHSTRHTMNTLLDERGVAGHVREELLGHTAEANKSYTHVADRRKVEATDLLGEAIDG